MYPKILITGSNGQVGFELKRACAPLGEVVALDRQGMDLAKPDSIRAAIRKICPHLILNAAAYTAVDKAESEAFVANAVNAEAPGIIGEEAAKLGALVIHYSTDYVFDGTQLGAYLETDTTNPLSVYGRTKLAGENALAASGARHLIFRTSWVFGAYGKNFIKTILRLALERSELKIVADQFGAPTGSALLADTSAQIASRFLFQAAEDFPCGVYHLTAAGETSWHGFARYVVEKAVGAGLGLQACADSILPISTRDYPTPAVRPANSRLETAKFRNTFGLQSPDWTQGVDQVLDVILSK